MAVTVAQAGKQLGVSTATVHRWLREGFITGQQMTRNAPWQIHITPELRAQVCQHGPAGWLPLADAATALGLARQTVLHKDSGAFSVAVLHVDGWEFASLDLSSATAPRGG